MEAYLAHNCHFWPLKLVDYKAIYGYAINAVWSSILWATLYFHYLSRWSWWIYAISLYFLFRGKIYNWFTIRNTDLAHNCHFWPLKLINYKVIYGSAINIVWLSILWTTLHFHYLSGWSWWIYAINLYFLLRGKIYNWFIIRNTD